MTPVHLAPTHLVSADVVMWICDYCPVAADTITSIVDDLTDVYLIGGLQYRVEFIAEEEYILFKLRWL